VELGTGSGSGEFEFASVKRSSEARSETPNPTCQILCKLPNGVTTERRDSRDMIPVNVLQVIQRDPVLVIYCPGHTTKKLSFM
jgi:hypothetical protein